MTRQTADEVIARYGLIPHPEGGHYREVHRSSRLLGVPPGYPAERVAITAIYFLLARGDISAFHRVRSEEVWVHLAGDPLELVIADPRPELRLLGSPGSDGEPLLTVPAGALQAARPLGDWALATCLVAPGFEFEDFEMPPRSELLDRYPSHAQLVTRFTR